jgi:hypothetical protein
MAKGAKLHIVRQGEHLFAIALRYGVSAEDVWSSPDNEALRKLGRTPGVLAPGDIIRIPAPKRKFMSLTVGGVNRFVATVPTLTVAVRLLDEDGKPFADEPWESPGLDAKGVTDGDGTIRIEKVPLATSFVEVHLPKRLRILHLQVGHLDPVSTPAGKSQRLAHLGYLPVHLRAPSKDALRVALERFQAAEAPDATGAEAVELALSKAHGA